MERATPPDARIRPPACCRYRQNPRVSHQVLGGRAVLLHYEAKRMLGLNDTGTLVWSLLDGGRTLTDIAEEVAERTGAPREEVACEVAEFVADLERRDLVVAEASAALDASPQADARSAAAAPFQEGIKR